jgi:hypothetical protein
MIGKCFCKCHLQFFLFCVLLFLQCNHQDKRNDSSKVQGTQAVAEESIKSSITDPVYPDNCILGIWAIDPNGPHADFKLDKQYYFIVDNEGNGNMLYSIKRDSIVVHFPDFSTRGKILIARNDTLSVAWDNQEPITYVRWQN